MLHRSLMSHRFPASFVSRCSSYRWRVAVDNFRNVRLIRRAVGGGTACLHNGPAARPSTRNAEPHGIVSASSPDQSPSAPDITATHEAHTAESGSAARMQRCGAVDCSCISAWVSISAWVGEREGCVVIAHRLRIQPADLRAATLCRKAGRTLYCQHAVAATSRGCRHSRSSYQADPLPHPRPHCHQRGAPAAGTRRTFPVPP